MFGAHGVLVKIRTMPNTVKRKFTLLGIHWAVTSSSVCPQVQVHFHLDGTNETAYFAHLVTLPGGDALKQQFPARLKKRWFIQLPGLFSPSLALRSLLSLGNGASFDSRLKDLATLWTEIRLVAAGSGEISQINLAD